MMSYALDLLQRFAGIRVLACKLLVFPLLFISSANLLAQEPFDHFSTGFDLDGAHANVSCDGCHTGGAFEGTNSACVSCHSRVGLVRASKDR